MAYLYSERVYTLFESARRSARLCKGTSVNRDRIFNSYVQELAKLNVEPKEYEQAVKTLANIFRM